MKRLLTLLLILLPMCVFGQDSTANYYFNKGMELFNSHQAHLAIPYFEKSDALEKKQLRKTDENYHRSGNMLVKCCLDLMNYYAIQGNKAEALKYKQLALKGCPDKTSKSNLLSLMTVGDEYYEQGMNLYRTQQSHLAVDFLQKSDSLEKAFLPKENINYNRSEKQLIVCWSDLANFFFSNGQNDWAIENQTKAVNSAKRVFGEDDPTYLTVQKTLDKMQLFISGKASADDYYNRGMEMKFSQPYDAISYFQKADTLEKATLEPSSPNYNRSILEIAECQKALAGYWFREKSYASAIDK